MVRDNDIVFDLENKNGTCFILIDKTETGCLRFLINFSLITIANNRSDSIRYMTDTLNLIIYNIPDIKKSMIYENDS
jgi:hypothetical protein